MRKQLKKTFIMLLAAMLSVTVTAGCSDGTQKPQSSESIAGSSSGQDSGALDPVELQWVLRIPEQGDSKAVLDKVNEMLQKEINATLDITFIDPAAYAEKTKLMISASDEFDVMFTSSGYGFYDYASKGAFVGLDEMLKNYGSKTYSQIPEEFWKATTIDGTIYGVPNYQIVARQGTINIRKELVEKYSIDTSSIKTVEDMEPILKLLKEKEPDTRFIFGAPVFKALDTMNYMGLEGIGADGSPGCIEIDGSDLKVINQFEYPSFVNLTKTLKGYEDAGYISKDLSLVKDTTELLKNGEILCSAVGNYKPGIEQEELNRYGYSAEYIKVTEPYTTTSSVLGTLQAISRTSKNPERAMMMLEIVNTNKDIYNTLVYGLEGKHYSLNDGGTIEIIPDSGYNTNVPWMIGNTFNGYLLTGTSPDVPEETKKLNEESKISRIMGFSFNPEPVKAEISQCSTVVDKYSMGLSYGIYDDVDGTLKQMNDELRAAGMDAVIAEKQNQLDEWAKKNA